MQAGAGGDGGVRHPGAGGGGGATQPGARVAEVRLAVWSILSALRLQARSAPMMIA